MNSNAPALPTPPPGFQIGYVTPRTRSRSDPRTPAATTNRGATMTMQSDLNATSVETDDRIQIETPTGPDYASQEPNPNLITKLASTMTKLLSRAPSPSSPRSQVGETPKPETPTTPWLTAAKSCGTPIKPDWSPTSPSPEANSDASQRMQETPGFGSQTNYGPARRHTIYLDKALQAHPKGIH